MSIKCPKCDTENTQDSQFCKKCATPLPIEKVQPSFTKTLETPVSELTRGTLFADRYEIIEELGSGGMGKVYRVEDTKAKEEIALKLIRPEIAADKKTIDRFRNELTTARKIRHKNVCGMYDLGEHKGTHYITMEYVSGEDLKSLVRRVTFDIGTAIKIAKQVCEGLSEAHRSGVIHRDLKPSNIMIDKEGNARIMDFGIARSLSTKGLTGEGIIIGTPEYMSPEQAEAKEVDHQSDIYSLGVIIYEMVTGQLPFEGDTPLSIAMKHKGELPKDPKELNAQITDDLSQLILKCMEKDKDKRYQGAAELLSELTKIEKGMPTKEKVVPVRRPEARIQMKRFKPFVIPGVFILFAVIVMTGYFFIDRILQTGKPEAETISEIKWQNSIAVLPFRDFSPKKDQEYFCDGMTDAIIGKLVKIRELKVISLTSVLSYKNPDRTIKKIGQELDVNTILEGSIQREDKRIRVNAQLINVADDSHLWSDTYDRKLESIFDVQDEISISIAEALRVKLTPDRLEVLKPVPPRNMEAYEYCLKGKYFIDSKYIISSQEEDFKAALSMLEKAIEIDPNYALAYACLSWAYTNHSIISGEENEKYDNLGLKYGEKAYELDPNLALSNSLMGYIFKGRGEYDKAYQHFKRAFEIKPNDAEINFLVGTFFRPNGLYRQAIKYFSRAKELDPSFFWNYYGLCRAFMESGEFEKSYVYIKKALELSPNNVHCLCLYVNLLIKTKKYDRAEEVLAQAEKVNPDHSGILPHKALLFAAKGEKDKALALWKNSNIYSLLGMEDEAIAEINEEIKRGIKTPYLFLINNPYYDNLRDDPRFQEIVKKQKKKYEEFLKKYSDLN